MDVCLLDTRLLFKLFSIAKLVKFRSSFVIVDKLSTKLCVADYK